jgi:hypothetical protein
MEPRREAGFISSKNCYKIVRSGDKSIVRLSLTGIPLLERKPHDEQDSPSRANIGPNLPWHKARIKFLARFLIAILQVRTVNLDEIATAFSGKAKKESNYKRLQRFFRFFEIPYAQVASFVVELMGEPGPWMLSLDRTNWKFGAADLNILMLSIVYHGIAFPLVWLVLPKAGNSNTDDM